MTALGGVIPITPYWRHFSEHVESQAPQEVDAVSSPGWEAGC
jgi:hypothetical protein